MKISKIIDELTELKEYIGDKDLEACITNDTTSGVNVLYQNDAGDITSTSLEDEKMVRQRTTMCDQEALDKIKVKVLHLDFCDGSNDPELVAMADVEVTNDTWYLTINGLGLRYNDTTKEYSIVTLKSLTGVCINEFTCRAVTSAVTDRYVHLKYTTFNN